MACFKPIPAWRTDDGEIIFKERGRIKDNLFLPCARCIGCRLEHSRQWAMRAVHEAKLHKYNSVVTLTYAPEHLPELGQLRPRDATFFFKRTLKALVKGNDPILCATTTHTIGRSYGATPHAPAKPTFRYFYCGEYGANWGRPHYHACLFGIDFGDKKYLATTPAGSKLWRSPTLERLWPYGHSTVGQLNFESAAYTARYVMKKLSGDGNRTDYEIIDPETGEITEKKKEFARMSRRPGIGKAWFDRYKNDAYPEGKVVIRGHKVNAPRYYTKLYKELDPLGYELLEYGRYLEGILHAEHNTDERLHVREQVLAAKLGALKRHNRRESPCKS